MLELNGRSLYKAPKTKTVDLMVAAIFEKPAARQI